MTNDQIRLHFGELNAAEMRLARAIVGWHEAREAKLRAGIAEAARDADAALRKCLNYMLRLPLSGSDAECEAMDDAHHALRKLQPFLKP
jgi:hypothetical protein